MQPTLNDVKRLAVEAGRRIAAGYRKGHVAHAKGTSIDLVTEVDQQVEDYLLGEIRRDFPGHAIVAEESGGNAGNGNGVWFIDPIDGTTNFAHNLPIFSVSLAFALEDRIQIGVVYNPVLNELFCAVRGEGAWLNDEPIHCSTEDQLHRALLVTGFPYDRFTNPANNLKQFNHLALKAQGVRRLGSAALDLCYIAAGRVDGYWEIRLSPWDMAAGWLIAEEAGARVTRMDGEESLLMEPYSILAANPALHAVLLNELRAID
jgi:myo-inositol-1(or 4)-monophosphatase